MKNRIASKILALALTLVMVLSLLPVATQAEATAVADWSDNIDGLEFVFAAGGGSGTPALTYGATYGNISATPWTGQWYERDVCETYIRMDVDVSGSAGLNISGALGGNARVPGSFAIQYKIGTGEWTDFDGNTITGVVAANTVATAKAFSIDLPAVLDYATDVQLRLVQREGALGNGTPTPGTNAGSLYIYNMKLTGEALVAMPSFSPAAGVVAAGTQVSITTTTAGADIFYALDGGTETKYTAPLTINESTTVTAYAKLGSDTSATATAVYTVPAGETMTIKEVLDVVPSTAITLTGQLVYRFGNFGSENSAVLQDTIDGQVYAISAFNSITVTTDTNEPVEIGDWITVTADSALYGGVPQLQNFSSITKADSTGRTDSSAPLVLSSFAALESLGYFDMLNRYIKIENVSLGAYVDNGTTIMTDSLGGTLGIYRAAPYPIDTAVGEVVNLYGAVGAYNATKQLRNGSPADYEILNDTRAPHIYMPTFNPAELGVDYVVTVTAEDNYGIDNLAISYVINGTNYGPFVMTPGDLKSYSYTIPGAHITGGSAIAISITATDAWSTPHTTTETGSIPISDEPRVVTVVPTAGYATGADKRPTISATFENAGSNPTVTMKVNDAAVAATVAGNTISYTPTADMEDGKVTVSVTVTRTDTKTTTFTWSFNIGEALYNHYRGQLHSHTAQYSDGSGTLVQALEYAKNTAKNIDFLAVTDHSNYFDTAGNLGDLTDASKGTAGDGGKTKWQNAKETTESYTDDTFVALYGFEMTWSGQYGHMNTFNSIGIESRNNSTYTVKNGPGLVAYYDRLVEIAEIDRLAGRATTINQFNHPGTTFGTFEDFAHYSPAYDAVISMIEVGNGEGKVGSSAYWPSYQYYTLALDKGWHLAPTNNQDNHKGNWGDSNTARDVVITDEYTEAGLYEAMRGMHMYASEDDDIEVNYTLNGQIMGSVLDLDESATLDIKIDFNDPTDRVQKVSVIANGDTVVAEKSFSTNSGSWELSIPNNYSYYYVRVDQVDTQIVVTAPVWTRDAVKLGISSLTKDTVMEIKDEPITLTAALYNYQDDEAATVTKLEWSVDGTVVHTDNAPGVTLNPSSETPVTWVYPADVLGRHSISLVATMEYKDTEYTSNASIDFIVRDGANMATMLFDAYHSNFYVSGNYADSHVNFIALAAANGVRAANITEPITDAVLANCDLLVLTVPFKGANMAIGAQNYTQDEIDAIARYAAGGGNIILTSKSDRLEPAAADEKASAISNRILDAVGAAARIGAGIVVDNETKANEAFRLYFLDKDNINFASDLTENLLETTNTLFSCYNGAPVILNGATPIITAEESAWVSSFDEFFGGSSSFVPVDPTHRSASYYAAAGSQEDVVVMAEETLPGGGFLITAGVTFFSTFEVKVELENATTLQNANYQIAVNIFRKLNPKDITPIADIHAAGTENVEYTIEGYVTSNASGHDQDTAFFDCIYIQDDSGRGINVFPVAGDYRIGQKLQITGMTASYMGEIELNAGNDYGGEVLDITFDSYEERANLTDVTAVMGANKQSVDVYELDYTRLEARLSELCDDAKENIVEAEYKAIVTPGEAVAADSVGNYVEFEGTVTKVERDQASDTVGVLHVTGDDGETAIVFIDGYINCDCDDCAKDASGYHDLSFAEVGAYILVRGISSVGQNSYDDGAQIGSRIRIRNRADIELTEAELLPMVSSLGIKAKISWDQIQFAAVINVKALAKNLSAGDTMTYGYYAYPKAKLEGLGSPALGEAHTSTKYMGSANGAAIASLTWADSYATPSALAAALIAAGYKVYDYDDAAGTLTISLIVTGMGSAAMQAADIVFRPFVNITVNEEPADAYGTHLYNSINRIRDFYENGIGDGKSMVYTPA